MLQFFLLVAHWRILHLTYNIYLFQGGRLVSIHNNEENKFVRELYETNWISSGWLGITSRNLEGSFSLHYYCDGKPREIYQTLIKILYEYLMISLIWPYHNPEGLYKNLLNLIQPKKRDQTFLFCGPLPIWRIPPIICFQWS